MAAGFGTLRDHDIHARTLVMDRMPRLSAQRSDNQLAGMEFLNEVGRRRAERTDDHAHLRVLQRDIDQPAGACRSRIELARRQFLRCVVGFVWRQLRHAFLGQKVFDEGFLRIRNHVLHAGRGGLRRFVVAQRDQHIDTVRATIDVAVDPLEFAIGLLRRKGCGTEHAKAAALVTSTTTSRQ
ncbi:hypothetical protein V1282_001250 [Nitrobacteraceae bacterium AZCC 2146]